MNQDTAKNQLLALLAHLDGAYAPNTLRAYRADMLEFIHYCAQSDSNALPASPATVASFLLRCTAQNIKTATIRRKVASISAIHRLSYLEDPTKRRLTETGDKMKIEASVLLGAEDEEVEVHGKPNCGDLGRG